MRFMNLNSGCLRARLIRGAPCLFVQLNSEVVPVELSREPVALNMGCEAPVGVYNADAE
jgi:hypothetical protein